MTMTFVEASEKQTAFIQTMLNERMVDKEFETDLSLRAVAGELSKAEASESITALLKAAKKPAGQAPAKATEPGYYFAEASQAVFEVVKAKSGNLYAKKMVPAGAGMKKGRWEYAPGAMNHSGQWAKLTLAEAMALGMKWGYCCVCGRTLTKAESIAAGIGPICGAKF